MDEMLDFFATLQEGNTCQWIHVSCEERVGPRFNFQQGSNGKHTNMNKAPLVNDVFVHQCAPPSHQKAFVLCTFVSGSNILVVGLVYV
jgi:hypothetical protein